MSQTQTSNEGPSSSNWRGSWKIRRVPEVLLREQHNRHDYIPKMVSIGPYHQGNPELLFAEFFKIKALERFREVHERENILCYLFIKSKIPEIRNSYERGSTDRYSDGELTLMMLLDALFITVCMLEYIALERANMAEYPSLRLENIACMRDHFGPLSISIAVRDMCLVDNQIPIWIVVLLLSTIVPAPGDAVKILHGYVSLVLFGELYSAKISFPEWVDESMLHLFDLFYGVLAVFVHEPVEETHSGHVNCCFGLQERTNADLESDDCCRGKCRLFKKAKGDLKILGHSFHSLTELKAKGIHLKPSPTQSLLDVKFKSNFMYAELQLPTLSTCLDTKTLFLNMMHYELDPQTLSPGVVISYINLMKLLIVKPEDAKELREKNILLGFRGSDEEIVKMYQDFDTQGADNPGVYKDVKNRIQAHYNSKTKTWKAKLIHTYFYC